MTGKYHQRAADEIRNEHPVVTATPDHAQARRRHRGMLSRGPADAKKRATAARQYAIDHLDELHVPCGRTSRAAASATTSRARPRMP